MWGMPVTGDDATARAYTRRVRPTPLTIRPRDADDVAALVGILEAQQPGSGYPVRWPLPFPVEDFIARPSEVAAWVAVDDGAVVGHVALTDVAVGWEADGWCAGTGLPASALAAVSVLFVDPTVTAGAWAAACSRSPSRTPGRWAARRCSTWSARAPGPSSSTSGTVGRWSAGPARRGCRPPTSRSC